MPVDRLMTARWPFLSLALPLVAFQLSVAAYAYVSVDQSLGIEFFDSHIRLLGSLTMMGLIPGYLIAAMAWLMRQSATTLDRLAPISEPQVLALARQRLTHIAWPAWLLIVIGAAFGIQQNEGMLGTMLQRDAFTLLDVLVVFGNAVLWGCVALLIGWRVPALLALRRVAASLNVDTYTLADTRPLTRLATLDVLIIAGAMAFMPLQSLDAEFRWYNYEAGLYIGIVTVTAFFLIPLTGLRGNLARLKAHRVQELEAHLATIDRADIAALEATSAHLERVRAISTWGLDLALIARIVGYAVIAPMAWVGAALVENLVDSF